MSLNAHPKAKISESGVVINNASICPVIGRCENSCRVGNDVDNDTGNQNFFYKFFARCFRFLYIHPSFSPFHFLCFLFSSFVTIMLLVFFNMLGTFVLIKIANVDTNIGRRLTEISIYDELLSIPAGFLWGVLSDFIGRAYVYSSGFILIGAMFFSYPFASSFSILVAVRLIFALGSSACAPMMVAVLGDCSGRQRGRISGMVGTMAGLGAITASFFLYRSSTEIGKLDSKRFLSESKLRFTCFCVGAFAIIFGVFFYLATRKIRINSKANEKLNDAVAVAKRHKTSLTTSILLAFRSFIDSARIAISLRDLRIIVSYFLSMTARANTTVLVVLFPYWVALYYVNEKKCSLEDYRNIIEVKNSCVKAHKYASIYTGIMHVASLVFAPLWGILIDKIGVTHVSTRMPPTLTENVQQQQQPNKNLIDKIACFFKPHPVLPAFFSLLITTIGFFGLYFFGKVEDSSVTRVLSAIIGMGTIGGVVAGSAMASSEYVPKQHRGAVSGVFSFFGSFGILIAFVSTILLIEKDNSSPFLVLGFMQVLALLVCIVAMAFGPSNAMPLQQKERRSNANTPHDGNS